jgi:hypothetical protein
MRGPDPRIHLLRKKTLAKQMDRRVKPGDDSLILVPMGWRGQSGAGTRSRPYHDSGRAL